MIDPEELIRRITAAVEAAQNLFFKNHDDVYLGEIRGLKRGISLVRELAGEQSDESKCECCGAKSDGLTPDEIPLCNKCGEELDAAEKPQPAAVVDERIAKLITDIGERADRKYCQYIDYLSRDECLGEEAKLKDGTFGKKNIEARVYAGELFGAHVALCDVGRELREAFRPYLAAGQKEG